MKVIISMIITVVLSKTLNEMHRDVSIMDDLSFLGVRYFPFAEHFPMDWLKLWSKDGVSKI